MVLCGAHLLVGTPPRQKQRLFAIPLYFVLREFLRIALKKSLFSFPELHVSLWTLEI